MTYKRLFVSIIFSFWMGALPAWGQPFTLIDAQGRHITVANPPRRVVSLVPSITEILVRIGAGDRVVGATYHNATPPESATLPIIGGFLHPDIQRIQGLEPDLIFHTQRQRETLSKLGPGAWQLVNLELEEISDSFNTIRLLGRLFDRAAAAQALIDENQKELDLVARKTARIPPAQKLRVMRLMSHEKLMIPGDDTFHNELIRAAGGIPPQIGKNGPVVEMTSEELIGFDPQVIYGCGPDREGLATLFKPEGYQGVSAVKNGRIYRFPCDLTCRLATHTGYFVSWLSARIYREIYAQTQNQVETDRVVATRDLGIDLPYVKSARIIRSRISDFLHKTLVIDLNTPQTVVSTLQGQRNGIIAIGNHYAPSSYWGIGHKGGLEHIRSKVHDVTGLAGDQSAFLFTGADMDHLSVQQHAFKDLKVWALVTAGVRSNAVRTSRDEGRFYEPGTINILLLTNARLSPRAMSRAIITATEAKTAALADMDIRSAYLPQRYQATGTGTDNIIVAQGAGISISNTGGHSKMGELIAKAVYHGVQEAVFQQNGLASERHIFARLRDRRISPMGLVSRATLGAMSDRDAAVAELEAVLLDPRYAGFLQAAFAVSDDYEAGLIADTRALENWCRQIATDIAGREMSANRELVLDDTLPRIQRMAVNAILNGVYGRLAPPAGSEKKPCK